MNDPFERPHARLPVTGRATGDVLSLPQVTLVAIDTRAPRLAFESLSRSMRHVAFGRAVLFTHGWQPATTPAGLEVVEIPSIESGDDYSRFVLRRLPAYVETSHVLVTQWDGFVCNPAAWQPAFLEHDYIGAVWPDQPEGRNVGNGGFSLRSQRLLAAGASPRIEPAHPEDEALCRTHRLWLEQAHGVRFAPPALARRFAFENEAAPGAFGFHGPYHLPRMLDEQTLIGWLAELPDPFYRSRDARRLARALLARRMPAAARLLLQRRRQAGRTDANTRLLGVAATAMGWFSGPR